MLEKYKDIIGYEGLYKVSNLGNVYSIKSKRLLKLGTDSKGRKNVVLYNNGNAYNVRVHRLVAKAFIPNPSSLPMINHKDENPSNNIVSNLEWCSNKYNSKYSSYKKHKMVKCVELNKIYSSIQEAAKVFSTTESNISLAANKYNKTACGYTWEVVKCR